MKEAVSWALQPGSVPDGVQQQLSAHLTDTQPSLNEMVWEVTKVPHCGLPGAFVNALYCAATSDGWVPALPAACLPACNAFRSGACCAPSSHLWPAHDLPPHRPLCHDVPGLGVLRPGIALATATKHQHPCTCAFMLPCRAGMWTACGATWRQPATTAPARCMAARCGRPR